MIDQIIKKFIFFKGVAKLKQSLQCLELGAPLKGRQGSEFLKKSILKVMNKNRVRNFCLRSQMCTQSISCVLVSVFSQNSLCSHQNEKRGWHPKPTQISFPAQGGLESQPPAMGVDVKLEKSSSWHIKSSLSLEENSTLWP